MRRALLVLLAAVLVVAAARHFLNAPVDARRTAAVSVDIPEGIGAREIARRLAGAGVVRSPTGLVVEILLRGARDALKAGTYEISRAESGRAIIRRLVAGDTRPADLSVTFPEGFTLAQIASRLDARGIVARDAFLEVATVRRFRGEFAFFSGAPEEASLEGYLFPDTYRFHAGTSAEDIVRRMLRRFEEQWQAAATEVSVARRASEVHDVVTMASIVEREVTSLEDRRLVAGILWKRLDAGIGLDADATIRYAIGDWENPLTVENLQRDSPYNTRRYRGLPPGPIGNPGLDSLQAALAPAPSDYLYYLSAAEDRRTIYSRTLEEHNAAKDRYLAR